MREKLKNARERLVVLAKENVDVALSLLEQDSGWKNTRKA
jgi:hypothetical protein